jgi:hypothetical protein
MNCNAAYCESSLAKRASPAPRTAKAFHYRKRPSPVRIVPSLRADMIFGKDSEFSMPKDRNIGPSKKGFTRRGRRAVEPFPQSASRLFKTPEAQRCSCATRLSWGA